MHGETVKSTINCYLNILQKSKTNVIIRNSNVMSFHLFSTIPVLVTCGA